MNKDFLFIIFTILTIALLTVFVSGCTDISSNVTHPETNNITIINSTGSGSNGSLQSKR